MNYKYLISIFLFFNIQIIMPLGNAQHGESSSTSSTSTSSSSADQTGQSRKRERDITSQAEAPPAKRAKLAPAAAGAAAASATAGMPIHQTSHHAYVNTANSEEEMSDIEHTTTSSSSSTSSSSTSSSTTSTRDPFDADEQERMHVHSETSKVISSKTTFQQKENSIRRLLLQMRAPVTLKTLTAMIKYLDPDTLNRLLNKLSLTKKLKMLNDPVLNPLVSAIANYNVQLVPVLLEHGADPNKLNSLDFILIDFIHESDDLIEQLKLLDLFVAYGLDLDIKRRSGETNRKVSVLDLLLKLSTQEDYNRSDLNRVNVLIARIRQLMAAMPAMRAARDKAIADRTKAIFHAIRLTEQNAQGLPKELAEIVNSYSAVPIRLDLPPHSHEVIQALRQTGCTDISTSILPSGNSSTSTSTNTSSTTSTSSTSHTTLPRTTAAIASTSAIGNFAASNIS